MAIKESQKFPASRDPAKCVNIGAGKGKRQKFKNKKILITAGPTWVPLDNVRIISNIATGQTGIRLAESLIKLGAHVTLFLGPVTACCINKKIKVIYFCFFDELRKKIKSELRLGKYDIIIHSAAVSDFKVAQRVRGKLASGRKQHISLVPLPKIIRDIKVLSPHSKLVMFKLETGINDAKLINEAKIAGKKAGADIIVANRLKPEYKAFIIEGPKRLVSAKNKIELVKKLVTKLIEVI